MDHDRQWRRSTGLTWLARACGIGALAALVGCSSGGGGGNGEGFMQTNLVSNQNGKAPVTDAKLVNAWGLASTASGPWWVANNHSGTSTLYDGNGMPFPPTGALVVTIPAPADSPPGTVAAPTGLVVNTSSDFVVAENSASAPALFLFATEDGTISGWSQPVDVTSAILAVDNSSDEAIYKGLAIGSDGGSSRLYASNFHAGRVDVFDGNFAPVEGSGFVDSSIPAGFAPFGMQNIGGAIFVTYAKQDSDKEDDMPGPGNGYVDVFDTAGNLVRRFASQGQLNSPWGVVEAPLSFGKFGGMIIIGNFGDGHLNAFDPITGAFQGQLNQPNGSTVIIEGLWGLAFGNDGSAGSSDVLYFTAGPNDEANGLFGTLTAVGG